MPLSKLYGDIYYSRDGGLAETREVFLCGCDLPAAWRGRSRFVVAELGFGAGLNTAALINLWRETGPATGRLHIFSVEAHPLPAQDAARALGHWPELSDVAAAMLAQWPGASQGFHRLELPQWRVTLDVAVMEALDALSRWNGRADAWFLDGFAPSRNPAMWRAEVMHAVAAHSAPGARLATYTVAGAVRRDLTNAGFALERLPGFGKKRERLAGRLPGCRPCETPPPRVAIIGAGIAGAALSRAFVAFGVEPLIFERERIGAGASGGPAALVTPRLDAGLAAPAALFAETFRRAVQLYLQEPGAVISKGALQLQVTPKDSARFGKIASSALFDDGAMTLVDGAGMTRRLGEAAPPGLDVRAACVVDPGVLLPSWTRDIVRADIAAMEKTEGGWSLRNARGEPLCEVDVVCLAAGQDCLRLAPQLPLTWVRGQATCVNGVAVSEAVVFGDYVIPTRAGLLFGATHDRGDNDDAPREEDRRRNLAGLAATLPGLAARLADSPMAARTGVRVATVDYLPVAGATGAEPGLFILSGLGSRGFALAPLLAEHIAALALGAPSPLRQDLAQLVDPGRFAIRAARRSHVATP